VIRHDLLQDDFAAASFDLIHARAVLEHIADRDRALDRIVRWLAPGGWLVLDECSFFTVDSSTNPAYRHAMQSIASTLTRTGTDFAWAREFPRPLVDRGLEDAGGHAQLPVMRGGTPLAEFWSLGIDHLAQRTVDYGIANRAELNAARRLLADPGFWDLSPALFGAWGRRPTTPSARQSNGTLR
jgi:SAM-dependent methyltransferase